MISITEVSSGDRDQMWEAEEYFRAKGVDWIEQFTNHRPDMDRLVKEVHRQWKADWRVRNGRFRVSRHLRARYVTHVPSFSLERAELPFSWCAGSSQYV